MSQTKENDSEAKLISLIDSQFNMKKYSELKNRLTQNIGFLVVGVIGRRGVGKSYLLNQLVAEKHISNSIFPVETLTDICNQTSHTNGVDVTITKDRVILLDCMPILSLEQLGISTEKEKKIKVFSNDESENDSRVRMTYSPDIIALQLLSFFLSICHTVLVVDDNLMNYRLLKLVDLAHRLRPWISCNPPHLPVEDPKSNISHSRFHDEFHDYVAQVIFVENMCTFGINRSFLHCSSVAESYSQSISQILLGYKLRIEEQRLLRNWLKDVRLRWRQRYSNKLRKKLQRQREQSHQDTTSLIQLEQDSEGMWSDSDDGITPDESGAEEQQFEGLTSDCVDLMSECFTKLDNAAVEQRLHSTIQRPIMVYRFPLIEENDDDGSQSIEFRRNVLQCPRKHFSNTQNERFTELCWLEHTMDMWRVIKDSQVIPDYFFSISNSFISDFA